MKALSLLVICFSAFQALAAPSANLEEPLKWLNSLTPLPGVEVEIGKFSGLDSQYISQLPQILKQRIAQDTQAKLGPLVDSGTCSNQINVQFLNSVSPMAVRNTRVSEFESQFIRIELTRCLPGVTAEAVSKVWLSPTYQRNAFPETTNLVPNGDQVCQTATAFGVGRTSICYHQSTFQSAGGYFSHNYVDENGNDVDNVTYFREFFTALVPNSNGTTFYGIMYVRGMDLSNFVRGFAKNKIQSSNQSALDLLLQMTLNSPGGGR